MRTRRLPILFLLLAVMLVAASCSPPRINNTRLGSADLVVMTDRMAASLLTAEPITRRGPGGEPWIITLDRVHNLTNDIIPAREKRLFMARLRATLSQSDALAAHNLRFIVPAARARETGRGGPGGDGRSTPTHALTATFHAITNATRAGRSDTYLAAFQLLDLSSERILWEDRYEMKKAVLKNKFD